MAEYTIRYKTSGPLGERRSAKIEANSAEEAKELFKANRVPEIKNIESGKYNVSDLSSRYNPTGFSPRVTVQEVYEAGNPPLTKGMFDVPLENAQKTQIPGTLPTYKKAKDLLDVEAPEGKTLDYGAGLGLGSKELEADSFEPYPKEGFDPTYRQDTDIPSNSYKRLTNLNVLNVVPPAVRYHIVKDIGRVLEPGGVAVITTRGKDVLTAKSGKPGKEPMSVITSKGTYQKGFTPTELVYYLQQTLGEGFEVVKTNLGPAGAIVRKLAGPIGAAATIASMPTSAGEVAEEFGIMSAGEGSDYVPLSGEMFIDQFRNPLLD